MTERLLRHEPHVKKEPWFRRNSTGHQVFGVDGCEHKSLRFKLILDDLHGTLLLLTEI
jgi:hypothetical protein